MEKFYHGNIKYSSNTYIYYIRSFNLLLTVLMAVSERFKTTLKPSKSQSSFDGHETVI